MLDTDFYMLAPLPVTETEITLAPPSAEQRVYAGGTTYATDDLVWYAGNVWKSLQDSNTGNTPVEGAWWTDLGSVDQDADVWASGTTYATGDYAVHEGALWVSAADSNIGNTPSTASTEWTRVGAANRLKAFDGFIQDAAVQLGGLHYELSFTSLVTEIAVLRASGLSVTVTMTDATEGEVYNQTFDLQDDSAIIDAWTYCFNDFVTIDTVLIEDLPPYSGSDITVTIGAESNETASVGQIVFGAGIGLATTKVGTSVGIESYSVKDRDDFNRSIVVARPYSDTVDFDLAISTTRVGYVKRQLALREALPTLYYMSGGAPYSAIAYGFFQNFDILHSTTVIADCVLEIEGLG